MIARVLAGAMRHRLPGSSRITLVIARRLTHLKNYPLRVGSAVLYVDLADDFSHAYLVQEPCPDTVFEPTVQAALKRLVCPTDVVFDIGANLGWYTVMLAPLVREVHTFEPNPALLPLLTQTVQRLPNAHLHGFALSNGRGPVTFCVARDHTMSSMCDWSGEAVREVLVPSCQLDEVEAPSPDLVKMDVEGAELMVLQGARTILDRPAAPIVLFEAAARSAAAFGHSQFAARDFLLAMRTPGWKMRYLHEFEWKDVPVGGEFETCLAVPRRYWSRIGL